MRAAKGAVLFRTYFWDGYAARSAMRLHEQSAGLDFYVQVNETDTGPLDVHPFSKLAHTIADFGHLGLPCVAPAGRPPLWWNCDYSLYDAVLKLPHYDYYLSIECDVAANMPLRPLLDQVVAGGYECVTPAEFVPMRETWPHAGSCVGLPYPGRAWTPLPVMVVSNRMARYLLTERQRLGQMYEKSELSAWPISEGFFSSAVLSDGCGVAPLSRFADLQHFGSEAIFLEADPQTGIPGSFAHSVLDADRFWDKFVTRAFRVFLGRAEYSRLRHARESLIRLGRTEYAGWRIAATQGNLALDRPARQSSLSQWSRPARPNHADPTTADARGGNCGVLTGGFGFHTGLEDNPWWEVDLERICMIDDIRIYNSQHAPERARRFWVSVSSDGVSWTEVFHKTNDRVFKGNDDPFCCCPPTPVPTRYVRVTLDGTGFLHLGEIEVYGRDV